MKKINDSIIFIKKITKTKNAGVQTTKHSCQNPNNIVIYTQV